MDGHVAAGQARPRCPALHALLQGQYAAAGPCLAETAGIRPAGRSDACGKLHGGRGLGAPARCRDRRGGGL
eukprot:5671388-Lingulodinium_polyedra.AAC.1